MIVCMWHLLIKNYFKNMFIVITHCMFILKNILRIILIDINILGDFVICSSLRAPFIFVQNMSQTAIEFHGWWWVANGYRSAGIASLEEAGCKGMKVKKNWKLGCFSQLPILKLRVTAEGNGIHGRIQFNPPATEWLN